MSNDFILAVAAIGAVIVEAAKLAFDIIKWRDERDKPKK
ncbi:hypothetical protein BSTEL_0670 [Bifidobacterium stellenboschense]|uniref:Uncharacterized protein n=1 Tax=Bifidobacterium stellenboschense TaxID=762211 RepID=A0A087DQQ9_9BIFI|nr:hypothetical protein BSTEL_0670 [Bifidobacterium stellenboschense]